MREWDFVQQIGDLLFFFARLQAVGGLRQSTSSVSGDEARNPYE